MPIPVEYVPMLHEVHAEAKLLVVYVPAGQVKQVVKPTEEDIFPDKHARQAVNAVPFE
jgi:hypothetical protein